jgi:ABC-type uncharacterized transport system involved in gliding motility auxiliary subunit
MTGILGCLVLLAHRHPVRLDLTPEQQFTLSPHSRDVLARLTTHVTITAFYSSQEPGMRQAMVDLLRLYRDASPRVATRMLDLDRSPGIAEQLGVHAYNVAVVAADGRRERVDLVVEELLTSAVLRTAGTPPVPTYFVVGHGEWDPNDEETRSAGGQAIRALEADGFAVRPIQGIAVVPPDAALVVLAGPTRDLAAPEVDALAAFVAGGGALVVLVDPPTPPSVRRLLARFGIEPGDDVVVDQQGRLLGTDGLGARIAYLNQAVVPRAPEVNAILPIAQSLRILDVAEVRADYLGITPESTWADVDRRPLEGRDGPFREDHDRRGPLPVAVFARVGSTPGRVVVVGDADFATNLHIGVLGNRDLLLATAELAARDQAYTATRPPTRSLSTFSSLALTTREARMVLWLSTILPALGTATLAWRAARRRRRA